MDQDRRDAAAWAKEWYIRKKNRRLLMALAFLLLVALIGYMVNFTIVHVERTTFHSAEEMRKAMQGRYAIDRDYEDIIIEGDEITLTYLSFSHYDRSYAEKYGYDYSGEDSVYNDRVEKWDFRNGVIRTQWMGDLVVDKNGNIRRGKSYYGTFYKTDKPRPEPIDPSTLSNPEGDMDAEISTEEEEALEGLQEDLESTEDAAEDALIEGENDVQT
ncbi:MAG: hypothetical protein IKF42_08455 [Mogibacterium sp.]|nr:hypothetical protein [Mogibacterium sp.]